MKNSNNFFINSLKNFNRIFSVKDRKRIAIFSSLLLIGGFLEIFSLLLVYPLINLFIDSNYNIEVTNSFINSSLSFLFTNRLNFTIFVITIFITKTIFTVYLNKSLNSFLTRFVICINGTSLLTILNTSYYSFTNIFIS